MIQQKDIDHNAPFDWGRASENYAKYRDVYPPDFYAKLRELGIGLPGQHILDLGTGTGVLPRAMHAPGIKFTGVDISPEQIAMARELSQGMDIEYIVSPAEEIDFPPGTFDAAMACQCFHYMDKARLLPRLHQVLKAQGQFAILSMIWLPFKSKIARDSERLVLKYNPSWTGAHFRKQRFLPGRPKWAASLFRVQHRVLFDCEVPFSRESWHGRILACRGIGASSLPAEKIAAFEAEHIAYLNTLPEEFTIPHQIMMFVLQKK